MGRFAIWQFTATWYPNLLPVYVFAVLSAMLPNNDGIITALLNRAKWISINGTKYKVGAIVHVGFDAEEFPQFWEIVEIHVINNNVSNAMFIVSEKETVQFSEHYQAYEIAASREKRIKVVYPKDFTSHLPFNVIKPFGCRGKYICLRYEIDM